MYYSTFLTPKNQQNDDLNIKDNILPLKFIFSLANFSSTHMNVIRSAMLYIEGISSHRHSVERIYIPTVDKASRLTFLPGGPEYKDHVHITGII